MDAVLDALRLVLTALPGLLVVGGMLAFIHKRDAVDWERLAAVYGRPWQKPQERRLANLVLFSEGRPAKSLSGAVSIGIYEGGIGLRPVRLFHPFYRPLFVPFSEIGTWAQIWYVNARSTEMQFARTPGMRLVMPRDQADWIRARAEGRIAAHAGPPPGGRWPKQAVAATAALAGMLALAALAGWFLRGPGA